MGLSGMHLDGMRFLGRVSWGMRCIRRLGGAKYCWRCRRACRMGRDDALLQQELVLHSAFLVGSVPTVCSHPLLPGCCNSRFLGCFLLASTDCCYQLFQLVTIYSVRWDHLWRAWVRALLSCAPPNSFFARMNFPFTPTSNCNCLQRLSFLMAVPFLLQFSTSIACWQLYYAVPAYWLATCSSPTLLVPITRTRSSCANGCLLPRMPTLLLPTSLHWTPIYGTCRSFFR